jgi:hypothetical protein
MTPEKRKELEVRRALLLQKQQATEFVESRVRPFIEILQTLKKNEVHFNIAGFFDVRPEWTIFFDEILSKDPFAAFGLNNVDRVNDSTLIHALLDSYPSANAFRYVPDLPLLYPDASLRFIIETYNPGNEIVYFFYFSYPFVLELPLSHLKQVDEAELFNCWHGDVVIFPKNKEWLLAYSLEEEWRYGKKK